MKFPRFSVVRLLDAVPYGDSRIEPGQKGTVLDIYDGNGYEVEFNAPGSRPEDEDWINIGVSGDSLELVWTPSDRPRFVSAGVDD